MIRLCLFVVLSAGLSLATGCEKGPKRYPVSGRVLIDGKPLRHGFVRVVPAAERAAQATLDEQGRFTLSTYGLKDGVVGGTHKVAVIGLESISDTEQRWHAPPKYADARSSDLTLTVDQPTNSAVIELTWDGGEPYIERF